jgi:hypothetical protein
MTKLRIICICKYEKCIKFLSYLNWQPEGNSTFQLGAQNEGNCFTFIIRLRIICILHILRLIMTILMEKLLPVNPTIVIYKFKVIQ